MMQGIINFTRKSIRGQKRHLTVLMLIISVFMPFSCSLVGKNISGIYEPEGKSLLKSIEFEKDGTCYTIDSIMGFKQSMQYKVNGDKIIIGDQPSFLIIDSKTIEGIAFGLNGTFRKK